MKSIIAVTLFIFVQLGNVLITKYVYDRIGFVGAAITFIVIFAIASFAIGKFAVKKHIVTYEDQQK